MIRRLLRLRHTVADLAADQYVQGKAAQLAGGALIADGLIGLENPLDRKHSRLGIFGALIMMVAAGIMVFVGGNVADSTSAYPDGVMIEGRVTAVSRQVRTDKDGNQETQCTAQVTYTVDGQQYQVASAYSSSEFCSSEGSTVEVSYRPSAPGGGRVITSSSRIAELAFRWLPRVFLVLGAVLFVLRLGSILAGVWLVVWGRRRAREAPPSDTTGVLERVQAAWDKHGVAAASVAGPLSSSQSSPGASDSPLGALAKLPGLGGIAGVADVLGAMTASTPVTNGATTPPIATSPVPTPPATPEPAPTPTGPPAGWYQNPRGSGERWWDGTTWTEHVQNATTPPPTAPTG